MAGITYYQISYLKSFLSEVPGVCMALALLSEVTLIFYCNCPTARSTSWSLRVRPREEGRAKLGSHAHLSKPSSPRSTQPATLPPAIPSHAPPWWSPLIGFFYLNRGAERPLLAYLTCSVVLHPLLCYGSHTGLPPTPGHSLFSWMFLLSTCLSRQLAALFRI